MCPNCGQPIIKTTLKDQVWQVKRNGTMHNVTVPELTVFVCPCTDDYWIGAIGDNQIEKAIEEHTSKPCEC